MTSVKVMITIDPCCERLRFLTDILQQARTLSLLDAYQLAIENLILEIMPLITANDEIGIITIYESNLENILALRETAFDEWKNEIKNKFTPVAIIPSEP